MVYLLIVMFVWSLPCLFLFQQTPSGCGSWLPILLVSERKTCLSHELYTYYPVYTSTNSIDRTGQHHRFSTYTINPIQNNLKKPDPISISNTRPLMVVIPLFHHPFCTGIHQQENHRSFIRTSQEDQMIEDFQLNKILSYSTRKSRWKIVQYDNFGRKAK